MKAAVYKGPKNVVIEDRPRPTAAPGEVVVKVKYCGICGTDVHSYLHEGIIQAPTVFGHEAVGVVAEVGDGVERWKAGDRVAIGPPGTCGECYNCRHGQPNLCEHAFSRTIGLSPATDGAYAEYVKVRYPRHMLLPIPEGVTFEDAVLFDVVGVSFHGIRKSRLRMGDNAVVIGTGPIGLATMLLLKMAGAMHITALVRSPKKAELSLKYGADLALEIGREGAGLAETIGKLYGGKGADVVYECVGEPDAVETSIAVAKSGGQVVILGVGGKPLVQSISSAQLVAREIDLLPCFVYDEDEIGMMFGMLANKKLKIAGMVTDIIGLEEVVPRGLERLANTRDQIKVLLAP